MQSSVHDRGPDGGRQQISDVALKCEEKIKGFGGQTFTHAHIHVHTQIHTQTDYTKAYNPNWVATGY